jgi:hypothetical protein
MHAGDNDVESGQQFGILVQAAVLQDVHLDTGENPQRWHPLPDLVDHIQLPPQPIS